MVPCVEAVKKLTQHSYSATKEIANHGPLRTSRLQQPLVTVDAESPTTTHQYVEANLDMKERTLARIQDPNVAPRWFGADYDLLKFLNTL